MFRIDSFRIDWFDLLAVQGTLKSLLQHRSLKASVLQCSACSVLHTAGGILVLLPGIKLPLPEVEMQSLNCWTAREVPGSTSIPRCWMLYTKVCGSRRSLLYHLGSLGNRLSYKQLDTESEAAPEHVWTHPEGDLLSTVGSEPFPGLQGLWTGPQHGAPGDLSRVYLPSSPSAPVRRTSRFRKHSVFLLTEPAPTLLPHETYFRNFYQLLILSL